MCAFCRIRQNKDIIIYEWLRVQNMFLNSWPWRYTQANHWRKKKPKINGSDLLLATHKMLWMQEMCTHLHTAHNMCAQIGKKKAQNENSTNELHYTYQKYETHCKLYFVAHTHTIRRRQKWEEKYQKSFSLKKIYTFYFDFFNI